MNLHYISNLNSSNKAIFFIHGNSGSSLVFADILEKYTAKTHDLIAFDLPGHGDSPKSSDLYTLEALRNTVAEFINNFNYDEVILVGHSLGGHLSVQSLSGIKNVKGIVIFGTPPMTFPPAIVEAFLPNPNFPLLLSAELSNEQIESVSHDMANNNVDLVISNLKETDQLFRQTIGAELAAGKSLDEIQILKQEQTPICIIHGENDSLVSLQYLQNLHHIFL